LNPFEFLERVSSAIQHQPIIALLAALTGGVLSTTT